MTAPDFTIAEYVRNYEFRGEGGDYTPDEGERALLEDAINGFLADGWPKDALRALKAARPLAEAFADQFGATDVEVRQSNAAVKLIDKALAASQ